MSAVQIVEVGPRDGLQNEKQFIPTPIKTHLIDLLSKTGLSQIEATSFVSSRRIPQLKDAEALLTQIQRKKNVTYSVLIPNLHGLERALPHAPDAIAVFTTVSESFSQKNVHCSIDTSLEQIAALIPVAKKHHLPVRAYVSCIFACPYEGKMPTKLIAKITEKLLYLGCDQIALGDTVGMGTPGEVKRLFRVLSKIIAPDRCAVHFHDTYGQALANIYESLSWGVKTIDSSIAGLGGCPYAKGASGNVATEDVVYMLNGLNVKTGIDLDKLIQASRFISTYLHRLPYSKVTIAKRASR